MKYSKIPLAQTIVQLCKVHNIKHIVISPGSRNAPLTIGFTENHFFNCYSIVDERSAAFFALGIAQQLKHPVVVLCTSGSAVLNYFPAVAEAYYSNIPLIVISADRPEHLVGIGDGQTIKQKNVFGDHVISSANLKLDIEVESAVVTKKELPVFGNFEQQKVRFLELQQNIQNFNELEINAAINFAISKKGPVHLNAPFNEPLYETIDEASISIGPLQKSNTAVQIDTAELKACREIWKNASKKMILVGVDAPNTVEQQWLDTLANDDSVVVFTETTSNIHHQEFFSSIDTMISPLDENEFRQLQPEVLLTFGGLIVSKRIKAFLRKYQPIHHWHIDNHSANDTFFCLSKHFKVSPNSFFKEFLGEYQFTKSSYKPYWKTVKDHRKRKHIAYLEQIPFCDFIVFDRIIKSLPKPGQLQVGNSSAIRYTQLFDIPEKVKVFCNRGTSGIDGSTSTSIGAALIAKEPTTFITGDLSFFYDSNALWNNYIPPTYRIIIINNGGGGIFRILPGRKDTENFDTFFETKHSLTAKPLAEMFGFEYLMAQDLDSLYKNLDSFYHKSLKPKILEIFTPSQLNDKILLDYFKFIK